MQVKPRDEFKVLPPVEPDVNPVAAAVLTFALFGLFGSVVGYFLGR